MRFESQPSAPFGPSDLPKIGESKCEQKSLPKELPQNKLGRSFQPKWLKEFCWLEYSLLANAAFCYPCRQFGLSAKTHELSYTENGFTNWHNALKSFRQHEVTSIHINAAAKWTESERRQNKKAEVSSLLSSDVLSQRRYYMMAIVDAIIFLARNEIAFRGDWNTSDNKEGGIFNSAFELLNSRDQRLIEATKYLPPNVNYTSNTIQNEMIASVASCLRQCVVEKINKSVYFSIISDGFRDKRGEEFISISIRYVIDFTPHESLLQFVCIEQLDAKAIAEAILEVICEAGLDQQRIVSQCYDGAAVMSGNKTGVARRIEEKIGKRIPYIHCFNHRLHLVVVQAVESVDKVKDFFNTIRSVHELFSQFYMKQSFESSGGGHLVSEHSGFL